MILMDDLFKLMKAKNASDIHLTVGVPPVLRIEGRLYATQFEALTKESAQTLIYSIMTDEQRQQFEENLELDFSFGLIRYKINKENSCSRQNPAGKPRHRPMLRYRRAVTAWTAAMHTYFAGWFGKEISP